MSNEVLIEAKDICKYFPLMGGIFPHETGSVKAVNNVSLQIHKGETLGLVGESGCGKSTLGNVLLGLEKPTSGQVIYNGIELYGCRRSEYKKIRQEIQVIFQDPYESLNPRMTVRELVAEGLRIRGGMTKAEQKARVMEILKQVGLNPEHYNRYPHEFSGGQRQRIGIARALIVEPKLIICDEPVSALDVSVQAQILNLLSDLQKKYNMTYLFIAHGLNVVKYLSDRIGVMYLGQLVEVADSEELFVSPKHPYTQALISAIPDVDRVDGQLPESISSDVPSPMNLPEGCLFHPRCPKCTEKCKMKRPELRRVGNSMVRCHLYAE